MARTATTKIPDHLKDVFSAEEWQVFNKEDKKFFAAASWQDPANFANANASSADILVDLFPWEDDGWKPSDKGFRELQQHCWQKYRTFGPLHAAVNVKADLTAGDGFFISSEIYEVNEFIKDLFFSPRNKLYQRLPSWIVRMLVESELFVLLVVDDDGNVTVRNLEPKNIGKGADSGLITDPDDINTVLFYQHTTNNTEELIPDARFILEPEWMNERAKALGDKLDRSKISKITLSNKHSAIGGYRRFILPWKNLTGEHNIARDTSSLATVIEWVNLYIMAMKWELDYKRALCAYTIELRFMDTPGGVRAWQMWQKMTPEQRDKTNLMKPLAPGSRILTIPGMEIHIHAPNLNPLSNSNADLINLASAGSRMPQDIFTGDSKGATNASLKASRHPFVMEVESLQYKTLNWLKYEFLRCCITARVNMGGQFSVMKWIKSFFNKKLKLQETYKVPFTTTEKKGDKYEMVTTEVDAEPIDVIDIEFPAVKMMEDPQVGNLFLGSKNAGLYGMGISRKTLSKKLGMDNFGRERREQFVEEAKYGKPIDGNIQEQNMEQSFKKTGIDGSGKDAQKDNEE